MMIDTTTDKILCVDDEENILHLFHRTLGRQYNLYTANGSEPALAIIHEHGPFAVILCDYNMPGMNGVELLKQVRALSPNTVQIMLTGNIDLDVAIKTINETDVFRYLPKPCPMEVLRKITLDALDQYHLIIDKQHLTLELEQKNQQLAIINGELSRQKVLLEHELEMAKTIYSKVAVYRDNEPNGLDYVIAAKETVGGDFLLTHTSSEHDVFYLMMGDLTGHGLQSALAVFLVTEVFDALCPENLSVEQLAQFINDKMCRKLPTGLFCAALIMKLDKRGGYFDIWQGGLPDAYLLDQQGNILQALSSNNLPLGVLAEQDFGGSASRHDINEAQSLIVYSDGVTEQMGSSDSMFGEQRLQTALRETPAGSKRVEYVMSQVRAHQQDHPQCDDISLVEFNLPRFIQTMVDK